MSTISQERAERRRGSRNASTAGEASVRGAMLRACFDGGSSQVFFVTRSKRERPKDPTLPPVAISELAQATLTCRRARFPTLQRPRCSRCPRPHAPRRPTRSPSLSESPLLSRPTSQSTALIQKPNSSFQPSPSQPWASVGEIAMYTTARTATARSTSLRKD